MSISWYSHDNQGSMIIMYVFVGQRLKSLHAVDRDM